MSPAVLHGLLVKITFCKVNQYAASVTNSAISLALKKEKLNFDKTCVSIYIYVAWSGDLDSTFCKVSQYAASVINSAISFALSDVYIEYTYIKLSF